MKRQTENKMTWQKGIHTVSQHGNIKKKERKKSYKKQKEIKLLLFFRLYSCTCRKLERTYHTENSKELKNKKYQLRTNDKEFTHFFYEQQMVRKYNQQILVPTAKPAMNKVFRNKSNTFMKKIT